MLREHPAVADVAVVGVPSRAVGRDAGGLRRAPRRATATAAELLQLGQRSASARPSAWPTLRSIDELPRSAIGKVLKRELRDGYAAPREKRVNLSPGSPHAGNRTPR